MRTRRLCGIRGGDFKSGDFALRETIDFGLQVEPEIVAFDYLWAESLGSIQPSQSRFPNFDDQVEYVRAQGKEIAVWQTVGWVDRPKELGLSEADLLRGPDGEPRKASWSFFAQDAQHYVLDPTSSGTRQYLRERTRALIDSLSPSLIKLDFAYGLPPPDVAAPRDPAHHGEKLPHELFRIITETVQQVDPSITVQYYSIHPL